MVMRIVANAPFRHKAGGVVSAHNKSHFSALRRNAGNAILRAMHRRKDKPHIIVALQLNGAPGRNEFLGISQFLAHGRSWNLTLAHSLDDVNGALERGDVDGAVIGLLHDDRTLELVAASAIPTVLVDVGADRVGDRKRAIAYVRNDDLGIGRMAAEFFLSLGKFRSYAFIPSAVPRPWSKLREKAFFQTLREKGLPTFRPREGADLADFLRQLPKPVAVLAAWDRIAQDVVSAAKRAGLDVPGQVSVLGVDNDEIYCDNFSPAISSVKPDHRQMGEVAARSLAKLMRSPARGGGETRRLPPVEVVVRESTATSVSGADVVRRARAYVAANAGRALTPDEVADALHVSRRLLDKRFHEQVEGSVAALIRDMRLRLLKARLLRHRARPIGVLTRELGYPNPRYVKNLFLKTFGCSMRDWRKQNA